MRACDRFENFGWLQKRQCVLVGYLPNTLGKINQKNNNNGKVDDLKPYYVYTYKSITIHNYTYISRYPRVLEGRILD